MNMAGMVMSMSMLMEAIVPIRMPVNAFRLQCRAYRFTTFHTILVRHDLSLQPFQPTVEADPFGRRRLA